MKHQRVRKAALRQIQDTNWLWNRTRAEQPEPEIRDGMKIYPHMYAEGYLQSSFEWVQGS